MAKATYIHYTKLTLFHSILIDSLHSCCSVSAVKNLGLRISTGWGLVLAIFVALLVQFADLIGEDFFESFSPRALLKSACGCQPNSAGERAKRASLVTDENTSRCLEGRCVLRCGLDSLTVMALFAHTN